MSVESSASPPWKPRRVSNPLYLSAIRVRVHLGGKRRIDIAREYGYKDGSAITHILKRLQRDAGSKSGIAECTARLETELCQLSGVAPVRPMFGFLKPSKRNDPSAIADSVMAVATNPDVLAECFEFFGRPSAEERARIIMNVLSFIYCCACGWASSKGDARIIEACVKAVDIISNGVEDSDRFVRVGDYLISSYDLAILPEALETNYRLRIPVSKEAIANPEKAGAFLDTAARAYEVHFRTLIGTILIMRLERFKEAFVSAENLVADGNLLAPSILLADLFQDQVTGITYFDVARNPQRVEEREIRSLEGARILNNYMNIVMARLDAL